MAVDWAGGVREADEAVFLEADLPLLYERGRGLDREEPAKVLGLVEGPEDRALVPLRLCCCR